MTVSTGLPAADATTCGIGTNEPTNSNVVGKTKNKAAAGASNSDLIADISEGHQIAAPNPQLKNFRNALLNTLQKKAGFNPPDQKETQAKKNEKLIDVQPISLPVVQPEFSTQIALYKSADISSTVGSKIDKNKPADTAPLWVSKKNQPADKSKPAKSQHQSPVPTKSMETSRPVLGDAGKAADVKPTESIEQKTTKSVSNLSMPSPTKPVDGAKVNSTVHGETSRPSAGGLSSAPLAGNAQATLGNLRSDSTIEPPVSSLATGQAARKPAADVLAVAAPVKSAAEKKTIVNPETDAGFSVLETPRWQAVGGMKSQAISLSAPDKFASNSFSSAPIDQIISHLQLRSNPLEQQIRLTLSPAELGAIRITFSQAEGQIVGLIEVQKEQTRAELQQALGQLTAALETAGLNVARIDLANWNSASQNNANNAPQSQNQPFQEPMERQFENHMSFSDNPSVFSSEPKKADENQPAMQKVSDNGLNLYI